MATKNVGRFRKTISYIIGEDLTQEEYDKWVAEIALWLSETRTNETDPKAKAIAIMDSALLGVKLDGKPWKHIETYTLDKRIRQFCGYDIIGGYGIRKKTTPSPAKVKAQRSKRENAKAVNVDIATRFTLERLKKNREAYKKVLYGQFPFLDNPVYESKVNAYADTVVKLEDISESFLGAQGKDLENYLKIRDQLRKDLDDFMKLLRIHPSQIKEKVDEGDRGDVGQLIDKWEGYGELAELYEEVDAIQEAIQIITQLENKRLDGSPQLADWLLWHKTGCRGHRFICECKREYDLHGGFTKEEMYDIVEQAFKVFGYGIKRINAEDNHRWDKVIKQVEEASSASGGQILPEEVRGDNMSDSPGPDSTS